MITKNLARWVVYVPLFIIPFIPLYVANDLFFPFITGKGFVFRVLVEVAFAGWVVLALAAKEYRPRFSWILVLYGAFVLWMLIADLFGANPHKAIWSNYERMEGWVTLIHVFLFFLVSGAVLTADKLWRWWWGFFLAGSAIVSAYCLIQLSGGAAIHQGGVRVDGTFGNAAYLAAYLLFAIAVSMWQALESKGWARYAFFALAAIEAVIVFFTATRGAILGLVAAGIVGALLWAAESGKQGRKVALGIALAIIVLAGGAYLLRSTPFVQHDPTLARVTSIGLSDLSTRTTLWHMAFEGVAERPVLGWGQEGFNFVFYKYFDPGLFAQEPWFDRAHNAFIDWLVAGGIPGFLLFLATFVFAIVALYRGGASRAERVLLIAALTAYAVQALVVFDNLFTYVPLAAILATAHAVSSRPWKRAEELATLDESNLQLAAPIIAVLAALAIWFVNVPSWTAASSLVRAMSLTGSNVSTNVNLFQKALDEHGFGDQEIREQLLNFANNVAATQAHPSDGLTQLMNYALGEMGKEVALHPTDARLRLQYALGYRAAGDYQNALTQVEIARQLSPTKQTILIEQALDYWQVGDTQNVRDTFQAAYDLDPSFDALAPYVAAGRILNGDLAGGKAFLTERLGTTTANNEALILAYFEAKDFPDLILCLEQQLRDTGGAVDSYFRLAAAYVAAGSPAKARAVVQDAIKAHPEATAQATDFLTHIK